MRPRRRRLALSAAAGAALAALAAVTAGAASGPSERTLRTAGRISALAADGTRVAIAVRGTRTPRTCDGVVVWQPATGKTARLDGTTYCGGASGTSAGEWLAEVALAGTRVAWLEIAQGNHQERTIYTATLAKRKRQEVVWVANGNGAEGIADGDYVGNLHGDGSLLVYNAWEVCTAYPPGWETDSPMCEDVQASGDEPEEITRAQELRAIGASGGTTSVAAGESSYAAFAADAGRVAVREEASGDVNLLDAGGNLLGTVAIGAGEISGAALSGSELAVLRNRAIEVWDVDAGTLTKTVGLGLAAGTAATLTDLDGDLAVYLVGKKVRVLRLEDGAAATIAVPGSGPVGAELEADGLWYAYNLGRAAKKGRVVFVPMTSVTGLLP